MVTELCPPCEIVVPVIVPQVIPELCPCEPGVHLQTITHKTSKQTRKDCMANVLLRMANFKYCESEPGCI